MNNKKPDLHQLLQPTGTAARKPNMAPINTKLYKPAVAGV